LAQIEVLFITTIQTKAELKPQGNFDWKNTVKINIDYILDSRRIQARTPQFRNAIQKSFTFVSLLSPATHPLTMFSVIVAEAVTTSTLTGWSF